MKNDDESTEARSAEILDFWFGPIDDDTLLDREAEPFRTYFARWYGKDSQIDESIRTRFEPELMRVTDGNGDWDDVVRRWSKPPQGLLALTLLLDQFPRNMYRGTARMYAWDALGLLASERAREVPATDALPLVHRMFLSVPLMHAENLVLQRRMHRHFESFVQLAKSKNPANADFFRFALGHAGRHVETVEKYGRFPHRNSILGRIDTTDEQRFLETRGAYF